MVMIDEGLACDDRHIVTGFRVDTGNVFGQHGIFTEPGLIENIVQTAADRTGWLAFKKAPAKNHG
jgi:hypothetical protein